MLKVSLFYFVSFASYIAYAQGGRVTLTGDGEITTNHQLASSMPMFQNRARFIMAC